MNGATTFKSDYYKDLDYPGGQEKLKDVWDDESAEKREMMK